MSSLQKVKGFRYCIALGDTLGDLTADGELLTTEVADQSKLFVDGLPTLPIPADLFGYLDVLVSYVSEVNRVFVQLLNECDNLEWMASMLQIVYNDPAVQGADVITNPQQGQLCVAQYPLDGRWYRACVLERTSPSHIKVYFIDYGNTDLVDKMTVRAMTEQFVKRPPQAIAVQLTGVNDKDSQLDLSSVCTLIENRKVTIRLEANTGSALVASMTYPGCDGTDVLVNSVIMGRSYADNAHAFKSPVVESENETNGSIANTATVGIGQLQQKQIAADRSEGEKAQQPWCREHLDDPRAAQLTICIDRLDRISSSSTLKNEQTISVRQPLMADTASAQTVDLSVSHKFDKYTLLWMRTYLPACWERPPVLLDEHFVLVTLSHSFSTVLVFRMLPPNGRMVWSPQKWWMSHFPDEQKQSLLQHPHNNNNTTKHWQNKSTSHC